MTHAGDASTPASAAPRAPPPSTTSRGSATSWASAGRRRRRRHRPRAARRVRRPGSGDPDRRPRARLLAGRGAALARRARRSVERPGDRSDPVRRGGRRDPGHRGPVPRRPARVPLGAARRPSAGSAPATSSAGLVVAPARRRAGGRRPRSSPRSHGRGRVRESRRSAPADKLRAARRGRVVLLVLAAVLAGLAVPRRRAGPGSGVVGGLGVVGLLAAGTAPAFAPLDLLAPAVAARRRGVGVFAAAATASAPACATGDRRPGRGRPGAALLLASAAAGAGAVVAGVSGPRSAPGCSAAGGTPTPARRSPPGSPPRRSAGRPRCRRARTPRSRRDPDFLTSNADFYRIDTALRVPALRPRTGRCACTAWSTASSRSASPTCSRRPLVERTITLTCVSNPVGGDLISTARFVGVRAARRPAARRACAGRRPAAVARARTAGTPARRPRWCWSPDRGALLAVGMNGEALPPRARLPGADGRAGPLRLRVGHQVGRRPGAHDLRRRGRRYWLERGWARSGPIKTQIADRHPADRSPTSGPGRSPSPASRGRSTPGSRPVEVRVDGGPWQAATLATEVSGTPGGCGAPRRLAPGGQHASRCRATDETAGPRPSAGRPDPDGATGLPPDASSHGERRTTHGWCDPHRTGSGDRPVAGRSWSTARTSTTRPKIATLCARSQAATVGFRRHTGVRPRRPAHSPTGRFVPATGVFRPRTDGRKNRPSPREPTASISLDDAGPEDKSPQEDDT